MMSTFIHSGRLTSDRSRIYATEDLPRQGRSLFSHFQLLASSAKSYRIVVRNLARYGYHLAAYVLQRTSNLVLRFRRHKQFPKRATSTRDAAKEARI